MDAARLAIDQDENDEDNNSDTEEENEDGDQFTTVSYGKRKNRDSPTRSENAMDKRTRTSSPEAEKDNNTPVNIVNMVLDNIGFHENQSSSEEEEEDLC